MDDGRERALAGFRRRFRGEPEFLVRAPGRANLLGAHVDYSEGWVLPGAIDRAVWLACRRSNATSAAVSTIEALDIASGGREQTGAVAELDTEWLPAPLPERTNAPSNGTDAWLDLPRGVAWALARGGHPVCPMEVVFGGDLPIGAGVSSSAAVEMAFLMAWEAAGGYELERLERARLGRRVENDYLGVGSGIMDQFAVVHGRRSHVLLLDCRSLEFEEVPMPENVAVLVADSGIRRSLAESDYNSRPDECRRAVAALRAALPEIRTLRDVSADELEENQGLLSKRLGKRARHAVEECRRVRAGAQALRDGNAVLFGELMRESHESSRDLYEVSIPELDALAFAAWSSSGCYGARLSGAGFGGCINALVEVEAADSVGRRLCRDFERAFGRNCETFVSSFGDGASIQHI